LVIEYKPGEWYCIVARDEHDYEFKDYDMFGPKPTADTALDEMQGQVCNPGSFNEVSHDDVYDYERQLVENGLKKRKATKATTRPYFDRPHNHVW
jgi:hypothetical protein